MFDGPSKDRILSLKSKGDLEVAQLRGHDPALETEDQNDSKDYRITTLFRSGIIIMRECKNAVPAAERKVLLMRTGIKDGLAIFLNFEGVEQVEDDDPDFIPPSNSITTTLEEAVAYIMRVNKAFQNMFPSSNEQNTGTFITDSGKSVSLTTAKEMELKGREVVGPSTNWVNRNSGNIPHNCYQNLCNASYCEMRHGVHGKESEVRRQQESRASIPGPRRQLVMSQTSSFSNSPSFTTRLKAVDIADTLFSITHDVPSTTR